MLDRYRLIVIVSALGACHSSGSGGAQTDAGVDSSPTYSISIDMSAVDADELAPRTVTVTGEPGDTVVVGADRVSAGKLSPSAMLLDATGVGTMSFIPCSHWVTGCIGPANLTLALAETADSVLATTPINLVTPAHPGNASRCLGGGNMMYLQGDDSMFNGTVQSGAMVSWSALATPDQIELDVDSGGYRGIVSLLELPQPLSPGLYEDAQRAEFAAASHPGLEVIVGSNGCNQIAGRFEITDYTDDPQTGFVSSVTFGFEQLCDGVPGVVEGCFHYEATPPVSSTAPPPDPTKVSVQVLNADGTPDTSAIAIFSATSGGVVVDTQVDVYGEAEALLPSGGELTVIHFASPPEILYTYRGLVTGDHVVIHPPAQKSGAEDLMLASFVPPTDMYGTAAPGVVAMTACGSGNSGLTTGPGSVELSFYDGCRTSSFDMLTIAGFTDGSPNQFVWQTGLAHDPNGNVQIASNWATVGSASVTLDNVPANAPPLNVIWSTNVDALPVEMGRARLDAPTPGSESVAVSYPPGAGDGTVLVVETGIFAGLTYESWTISQSGSPSAITVDLTAQPVPVVSAVQQNATGLSWTQTSGGTADVRNASWSVLWHGDNVTWFMTEPYDGNAFTSLPSLPAAHASLDPMADPSAQPYGASVTQIDYDVLSGFSLTPPSGDYHAHLSHAHR